MDNNVKIFLSVVGVLILGIVASVIFHFRVPSGPSLPGKYDQFAQCLKDKGATFYGAWWCPHCQKQKKLFGSSQKLLPYVECYVYPDTSNQLKTCTEKKITGYPTWELSDGTRLPVENDAGVTLETLAAKTSCILPK